LDLFYYGSQDIPPRLGGGRDPREGNGEDSTDRVCEACSRPVLPDDLREGRASEIYGVVLCATCGGEDADSEERVELYFCDRCHVSVPVYRVDTGEALAGDGRILCLNCRGRSHISRLPRLAIVFSVLLVIGVAGAFVLDAVLPSRAPAEGHDAALEALDAKLTGLNRVLADPPGPSDVDGILSGMDDLEDAARSRLLGLERARTSLDRLRAEFDRRMEDLDGNAGALHQQVDDLMREADPDR
jgi:hypothetical protein